MYVNSRSMAAFRVRIHTGALVVITVNFLSLVSAVSPTVSSQQVQSSTSSPAEDLRPKRDLLLDEKRAASFNSWGGKRAPAFNSWGGKRAKFNSWGGKRAKFNSWGGKRAKFNSWGGKRAKFNSWGGKRAKFNSWGGKRSPADEDQQLKDLLNGSLLSKNAFSNWESKSDFPAEDLDKRAFSSWGGKRTDEDLDNRVFNSFAGRGTDDLDERTYSDWDGNTGDGPSEDKRTFSSWGGKRADSVMEDDKRTFNSWAGKRDMDVQDSKSRRKRSLPIQYDTWLPHDEEYFQVVEDDSGANDDDPYNTEDSEYPMATKRGSSTTPVRWRVRDAKRLSAQQRLLFNPWGGKRTPSTRIRVRDVRPIRRGPDFYAWGGKRSDPAAVDAQQ